MLVGCIYRPPSNTTCRQTDTEIISCLNAASKALEGKAITGIIVAGDFNLPEIDWQAGWPRVLGNENSAGYRFAEAFADCHLCQVVSSPTFTQADGETKNTLDLVLTDSDSRIDAVQHGPALGNSLQYHHMLRWSYNLSSTRSVEVLPRRNYAKAKYEEMNEFFRAIDWTATLEHKPIEAAYLAFTSVIQTAEERFVPLTRRKLGSSAPWVNSEIKSLVREKRTLWHTIRASGGKDAAKVKRYRQLVNLVKRRMISAVHEYEQELANDKKNPKRVFHYIKMRQRTASGLDTLRDGGLTVTDQLSIANIMNEHFAASFVLEPAADQPTLAPRTESMLSDVPIVLEDVSQRLRELDASKSPGGDGMHASILKHCYSSLALPLCCLFRQSLDDGQLLSSWREANVTPLHKKGDRSVRDNYRPISLMSIICKVLERILRDHIMLHLTTHQLIAREQHGFVPKKSCITNLLESAELLTKALQERRWLDVLYIDFSKAFDSVPHLRLINKLAAYGIDGKLLRWIQQFLSNRRQRVVMGSATSQWAVVTSGVPQGSVLGPLLFTIYINDLLDVVMALCKLYADDAKLFADNADELQRDIEAITAWCEKWLMRLNVAKCHVLHVGKNNPRTAYFMSALGESRQLATTSSERDLGVIVSSSVRVSDQVQTASAKANAMLGVMKKTFTTRDKATWKKLYTTFVRPQLEYAIQSWSPYLRGDIAKLEAVQRRATKTPIGMRELAYEDRLAAMSLTTLEERRKRGDLIQMYKIEKGIDNVEWHYPLSIGPPLGDRRGRMHRELVTGCAQRYNFFSNRVAHSWNKLPDSVVSAPTVNSFKARLDNYSQSTSHKNR